MVSVAAPSPLRRLAQYLVYPAVFLPAVGAIVGAVGRGVPYWRVGPPVVFACALAVVALERWLPHARAWQRDQGDTRTDLLHYASNVLTNQAAVGLYAVAWSLAGSAPRGWPSHWPFAAQFVIAALVLDLSLYTVHRASHRVSWLWRLHAIHHSPHRIYWLNGQRRHLLHEMLEGLPGLLVLGALGAPVGAVGCYMAAVTIHLMFQHGNIAYRAGPLRFVFAVAELHRWHHQRRYADVQGNYGAVLSVWDYALGTALRKTGEAPLDVGMDDAPDLPPDYVGQLAWPFRSTRRRGATSSPRASTGSPSR